MTLKREAQANVACTTGQRERWAAAAAAADLPLAEWIRRALDARAESDALAQEKRAAAERRRQSES